MARTAVTVEAKEDPLRSMGTLLQVMVILEGGILEGGNNVHGGFYLESPYGIGVLRDRRDPDPSSSASAEALGKFCNRSLGNQAVMPCVSSPTRLLCKECCGSLASARGQEAFP
jgi:hypothetical protein